MKKIKLEIPRVPDSLNKMLNHHWTKRQADKAEWLKDIQTLWLLNKKIIIQSPIKITLEYFFKDNRKRDYDNYSGKYILDGLKETFIEDDNARDCLKELVLKMNFKSSSAKTRIIIESIDKK